MKHCISSFITMNLIKVRDNINRNWNKVTQLGVFRIFLINIEDITAGNEDVIEALKDQIDDNVFSDRMNSKYTHDLFYIAPLYHRMFKNLEKIIFLDIDIMFNHDVNYFWKKLENMGGSDDEKCIGLGHDLSPHYYHRSVSII